MTLPASGAISLGNVNTEIGYSSTATISLNDTNVRVLAQKSSGVIAMSDLQGKAWLTQEMVMDWVQDNRGSVFNWVHGGSGDSRYVNNPYNRYVTSQTATFSYSLSGASLPASNWTTIVLTATAKVTGISSYSVNSGAISVSSASETYNSGGMRQVRLLVNANFKDISSVTFNWTCDGGNSGSWASCLILPGKWESFTAADPGTSISIPTNSIHIGSMNNGGLDGSVTLIGGAPTGGARMWFDAWWYNNGALFMTTNASSSSVTQTFSGTANGFSQYGTLLTSMASA